MTGFALISLIAMGVVFAIWAVLMFQMLWSMSRDAGEQMQTEGGGIFSGTGHRWRAFWAFFSNSAHQKLRRRILLLTVLMFAIIIGRMVILPLPAP